MKRERKRPGNTLDSRFLRLLWAILLGSAVLGGCDDNTGGVADHLDSFPRLSAEVEARIGDFDDPDIGFSRVLGVDVDDEGNVYVLEGLVPEIRVYSPDGNLLRRIGRRGGGPGEFERAPRFGVFGDTVWAIDNLANRITLFDRKGTVLSTGRPDLVTVPLPGSSGHVLPWMMRPDGKFTSHLARVASYRGDPPTGVQPTDSIPVPLVLFDATGAVTDTIGWAGRPPPRMWRPPSEDHTELNIIQVGDRRLMVPSPPTTLPWWEALLDGYLLIETPLAENRKDGVFTVTRFGLSGDTVYSRALHYEPILYSEADLDSVAARAARGGAGGMAEGGASPVPSNWAVIARSLRAEMKFPEFKLPIHYTFLAQDGSIWLRRREGDRPTARWILLDAQGRSRGELELPSDLRIQWSRGDTFWAVDPDEYEVPWVVRFRIRSPD
jgi:hypothetical protein